MSMMFMMAKVRKNGMMMKRGLMRLSVQHEGL